MKKSIFLFAALLTALLAVQSCTKTDKNDQSTMVTSEDLANQENLSHSIDLAAEVAVQDRGGNGSCPTVTLAKPWGTWPNTLTVDYGPDGCTGPGGNTLKGKIIIDQTAELYTAGATRTLSFESFSIDGIGIQGTRSWTNNGLNAAGLWSFSVKTTDAVLSYPDGTTNSWNQNHTLTIIEGGSTFFNPFDDVWSITGTISGKNRDGVSYSAAITSPLIKKNLCQWVSGGVLNLNVGGNTADIDYGNNDCDKYATVTLPNGDSFQIQL